MSSSGGPGPRRLAKGIAGALARLLLVLYPPSFRRELGDQIVDDVRRRATELADAGERLGTALWLPRLGASLLANAVGAWRERLVPSGSRPGSGSRGPAERGTDPGRWSPWDPSGSRPRTFSWIDVKLGLRMLVKHPGLSLAGGLGIAVAIAIGAGFFAFAYSYFYPTLPLDQGERLVALENWDLAENNENRRSIHDYHLWRDEMESVVGMSAFRNVRRNLIAREGDVDLVQIAEMTPSGFTVARVPPLMGRTLVEGDAEQDATPVLVIGHEEWQGRFGADPEVLGKEVRIGRRIHTIVGVMPEGFAFPMNHTFWTPLKARPSDHPRGEGPWIYIFGRLAPGYTLDDAQAELTVIGRRMAEAHPETHGQFRAQVMPYIYPLVDVNQDGGEGFLAEFAVMNGLISLLLVVVCVNVAVLVYARTATRRGEIAVRTALGASRKRVVGQLFVESLVLSAAAAAVGLGLTQVGLHYARLLVETEIGGRMPFWTDFGLPGAALVYAAVLTLLAAVITGVLPGLQATGKRMHANLQRHNSGTGLRMGRTWTTLVVIQVSIAVAVLPLAAVAGWWEVRGATTRPTLPLDRYMAVWVIPDPEQPMEGTEDLGPGERLDRFTEFHTELARRLQTQPGVLDHSVTPQASLGGSPVTVTLDGGTAAPESGATRRVRSLEVGPDFFRNYGLEPLSGRVIRPVDTDTASTDVVVVNRAFVRRVLGGGDALGRRFGFRSTGSSSPDGEGPEISYEIVGVVEDLFANPVDPTLVEPRIFRPVRGPWYGPVNLTLQLAGSVPPSLTGRIRRIAAELDPTIRVRPFPLSEMYRQEQLGLALVGLTVGLAVLSVLLLSAAGIYALMSFTVTRRRREIGIRRALGAQPGILLRRIFARAAGHLGLGMALGVGLALTLDVLADGEMLRGLAPPLLTGMVLVMGVVGLLAAAGPARRGLRIEPAEVLKEE